MNTLCENDIESIFTILLRVLAIAHLAAPTATAWVTSVQQEKALQISGGLFDQTEQYRSTVNWYYAPMIISDDGEHQSIAHLHQEEFPFSADPR